MTSLPPLYGWCRLRGFAHSQSRLWVRDRRSPAPGLREESDLVIRDFSTFQNVHGEPDGRMEQVPQKVEGSGASGLRRVNLVARSSSSHGPLRAGSVPSCSAAAEIHQKGPGSSPGSRHGDRRTRS